MNAVNALSALAQGTRLEIYRYLVRTGPEGSSVGGIAERFGLPGATLSFHLTQLRQAGLAVARRDGRQIIYAADFARMNDLMAYLTENCCQGNAEACLPPVCPPGEEALEGV